jgi:hypothetical protein
MIFIPNLASKTEDEEIKKIASDLLKGRVKTEDMLLDFNTGKFMWFQIALGKDSGYGEFRPEAILQEPPYVERLSLDC